MYAAHPWRLLLPLLVLTATATAQDSTRVTLGSVAFNDGVHPAFSVSFADADPRLVERHWRTVVKDVSHKVSTRKELVGTMARIPTISPDTMRILVKTERTRGLPLVTVHMAFLTVEGAVGSDANTTAAEAAKRFVYGHAVDLRRQVARDALKSAERQLAAVQGRIRTLEREQGRAEEQRERSRRQVEESAAEAVRIRSEQEALATRIATHREVLAANPSEEGEDELKDLLRDQQRLEKGLARTEASERKAAKRIDDLGLALERNAEARTAAASDLEARQQEVAILRQALEAIR